MNTVFVVFAAVFMRALEFLLTSSTTTLRLINCPHDIPSRPPGATTELSTAEGSLRLGQYIFKCAYTKCVSIAWEHFSGLPSGEQGLLKPLLNL